MTISLPGECPTQQIYHTKQVFGCGQPLTGWHCNPKYRQVPIKVYGGGGCPTIPVGDVLDSLLESSIDTITSGFSLPNIPLTVPCTELDDITETFDPGDRWLWTADSNSCDDEANPPELTRVEPVEWGTEGNPTMVVGLYGEAVTGDPREFDFAAFVPEDSDVGGNNTVSGLQELALLLSNHQGPSSVGIVNSIQATSPPMDWVDGMGVKVSSLLYDEMGGTIESESDFLGDFRANGDFRVERFDVLDSDDPEIAPQPYSEIYTSLDGTIFTALRDSDAVFVNPRVNGAATGILQGPLGHLSPVSQWLNDPYRISLGSYVQHETSPGPMPSQVYVTQSTPISVAAGASHNELSRALFGHSWTYLIDVPTERVLSAELKSLTTGLTQKTIEFGRYAEVTNGVWRPLTLTTHEFGTLGQLIRRTECLFTIPRRRSGQAPQEIALPESMDNTWLVRVR